MTHGRLSTNTSTAKNASVKAEVAHLLARAVKDPALRKEVGWLSLGTGIVCGLTVHYQPHLVPMVRDHLGDLLTAVSILFGFVVTAFATYVPTLRGATRKQSEWLPQLQRLVMWHTLTAMVLLMLIGYILAVWILGSVNGPLPAEVVDPIAYGVLAALTAWGLLQVAEHAMTLEWYICRFVLGSPLLTDAAAHKADAPDAKA